jgi:iron(III) transport system substrate-binding protein
MTHPFTLRRFLWTLPILFFILFSGCRSHRSDRAVIIYTSVDQVYSEPIFHEFQRRTGITVKPKYDVEAVKTIGLINAIVAEQESPRCDVLWNNEIMHTIILKEKGLLVSYLSPSAEDISERFKDKQGFWTGMGARARVIIYNKKKLRPEQVPRSMKDFLNPKWRGKGGIALPLFGTTATHAAALFSLWGEKEGKVFFQRLKENGIVICTGNAHVKDQVSSGELVFGLTDTDDAHVAFLAGSPTGVIFPDREGIGVLILPCTVAMIKGSPHPKEAKILIDYLLSNEVEEKLAFGRSAQIPLHPGAKKPTHVPALEEIVAMNVDYEKMADLYPSSLEAMKELFLR